MEVRIVLRGREITEKVLLRFIEKAACALPVRWPSGRAINSTGWLRLKVELPPPLPLASVYHSAGGHHAQSCVRSHQHGLNPNLGKVFTRMLSFAVTLTHLNSKFIAVRDGGLFSDSVLC